MLVERTFYVTQESLSVWMLGENGLVETIVFPDDDAGLRRFDAYLGGVPELPSALLIDVIEEEFALDTIPRLGWRDRRALLERRCQNKFRRTPYRLSQVQGRNARNADELDVLHSAISNHELLDPWLQIILRHRTPLAGVYSVPLLAAGIFRRLGAGSRDVLCVSSHQGDKLRQVFLSGGRLRSARLTQAPSPDDADYPQFIVTEAVRSRRYLERLRLLDAMQVLEVRVVADEETAAKIDEIVAGDDAMEFSFVDPAETRVVPQSKSRVGADRFEEIYVAAVMRRRAKLSYARAGEDRYWTMRRMRRALIGGTAALAAACSVAAAVLVSDAWFLHGRVVEIQSQLTQLSETFRRENERFNPIQADSHEMKLAVDTGDFILDNRVPVPWAMNQLGTVLGAYPDVNLRELRWRIEVPVSSRPPPRRGERPMPVPVHTVDTVSAVVMAEFAAFDGDMRRAFSRIDALARDLEEKTDFSHAMVVEYPFNNSPNASISGEISRNTPVDVARFRLRLSYRVPGSTAAAGEGVDDTV